MSDLPIIVTGLQAYSDARAPHEAATRDDQGYVVRERERLLHDQAMRAALEAMRAELERSYRLVPLHGFGVVLPPPNESSHPFDVNLPQVCVGAVTHHSKPSVAMEVFTSHSYSVLHLTPQQARAIARNMTGAADRAEPPAPAEEG